MTGYLSLFLYNLEGSDPSPVSQSVDSRMLLFGTAFVSEPALALLRIFFCFVLVVYIVLIITVVLITVAVHQEHLIYRLQGEFAFSVLVLFLHWKKIVIMAIFYNKYKQNRLDKCQLASERSQTNIINKGGSLSIKGIFISIQDRQSAQRGYLESQHCFLGFESRAQLVACGDGPALIQEACRSHVLFCLVFTVVCPCGL